MFSDLHFRDVNCSHVPCPCAFVVVHVHPVSILAASALYVNKKDIENREVADIKM